LEISHYYDRLVLLFFLLQFTLNGRIVFIGEDIILEKEVLFMGFMDLSDGIPLQE